MHLLEQRRAARLDVAVGAQIEVRLLARGDLAHARSSDREPFARGDRHAPRLRQAQRRSALREAAPLERVEQLAVDRAHRLRGAQPAAQLRRQRALRLRIARARARGVEREQARERLARSACARSDSARDAAGLAVLAREVDAPGRGVLADVAQHVGELDRDAQVHGVVAHARAAQPAHAAHEQADRRRDAVAVVLELGERLDLGAAQIDLDPREQVEEAVLGQMEAVHRVAERDPDRMARLAAVGVDELLVPALEQHRAVAAQRGIVGDVVDEPAERVDRVQRAALRAREHPERREEARAAAPRDLRAVRVGGVHRGGARFAGIMPLPPGARSLRARFAAACAIASASIPASRHCASCSAWSRKRSGRPSRTTRVPGAWSA